MSALRIVGSWMTAALVLLATVPSCRCECRYDPEGGGGVGIRTYDRNRYSLNRDYATKYAIPLPLEMTFTIDNQRIPRDRVKHGRPDLWKDLGPDGPYIGFTFFPPDESAPFESVDFLRIRVSNTDREAALNQLRDFLGGNASRFFGGAPCEVIKVERRPQERRESMNGGQGHSVDRVTVFAHCRDPKVGDALCCAEALVPTHSRHGVIVASIYFPGRSPVTGPEKVELGITASIVESLQFGDEINFEPP